MGSHARLAPSSAERWTTCPASVQMEAGFPDRDSEYSKLGTAAHKLLEHLLRGTLDVSMVTPGIKVDEIELDQEDIDAVMKALTYVYENQGQGIIYPETKVDAGITFNRTDCKGTADVMITHPDCLEVIDYKHGSGVCVDVVNNKQAILYALGALSLFDLEFPKVKITIIQPRIEHEDGEVAHSVEYTREDLNAWAVYFGQCATLTDEITPTFNPVNSKEVCGWCKARATCPALAQKALVEAQALDWDSGEIEHETVVATMTRQPASLTPAQIKTILDNEDLIRGWLNAVHEYAREEIMAGREVEGYKLVNGRRSKSYDCSDTELTELLLRKKWKEGKKAINLDDITDRKVKSPAQLEKHLKPLCTEQGWAKVKEHIIMNAGKPVLAPIADRRKAIAYTPEQAFADVPAEGELDLSFLD